METNEVLAIVKPLAFGSGKEVQRLKFGNLKNSKFAKVMKRIFMVLLVVFAAAAIAGVIYAVVQISKAPDISEIDATPHGYMTTILDKDGNVTNHLSVTESNRIYVKLEEIPKHLQDAFIAIEDARFYKHGGIDLIGIARAAWKGITTFDFSQGASTITQQLLKNNVFTEWMSETSFMDRLSRKIQEQYLAIRLEQEYSKEWILENYLNTINLGGGTRGVQVAAQYYFSKDVSELTLAESALIAGITKNPSAYNPFKNPEKSLERQHLVLNAMLDQEIISKEVYDQAMLENVITKLNTASANAGAQVFSWFEDAMLMQIVKDLTTKYTYTEEEAWDLVYSGGLTIHSTVDTKLQDICEEAAVSSEWYNGEEQISIVMTDVSTGAVAAIVGGREEKTSSLVYNRATSAIRQPGSTIKILGEYAAALDTKAITLGTVLDDTYYEYSDGTVIRNGYGSFKGMTTVRDAIAVSGNVIALKVFQMAGVDTVWKYLEDFGITTLKEEDRNEALAIGGTHNGVTNLEMTAAYNAIANDGNYVKPYFYTTVVDRNQKVILSNEHQMHQAVSKETADLLTSAMEDVITSGTGKDCAVKGITLAGKSGTTNDNRDLWFMGFSSYYTCGIWGGYDDNSSQSNGSYVKKIWQDVMELAHQDKENKELVDTKQFKTAAICKKCGKLAEKGLCDQTLQGDMIVTEYFRKGEKPSESCDCHVKVTICKDSNMPVSSFCPSSSQETKIYLKEGSSGTDDAQYVIPAELKALLEAAQNGDNTAPDASDPGQGDPNEAGQPEEKRYTCNIHTDFWDLLFPPKNPQENQETENETDSDHSSSNDPSTDTEQNESQDQSENTDQEGTESSTEHNEGHGNNHDHE